MNIEKNKKIIESFVQYYNNSDIENMLDILDEEIEFMNLSNDEITVSTKGKEQFKQVAKQTSNIFLFRNQKINSIEESNDVYFVELEFIGKLAIDLPNGMKAGQEIKINGKSEYILKEGKIIKLIEIS